jgi:hypothetical protein
MIKPNSSPLGRQKFKLHLITSSQDLARGSVTRLHTIFGGGKRSMPQPDYARCEKVHEVAQYLDGKGNHVSASASC